MAGRTAFLRDRYADGAMAGWTVLSCVVMPDS
jgi:hypothetical protein